MFSFVDDIAEKRLHESSFGIGYFWFCTTLFLLVEVVLLPIVLFFFTTTRIEIVLEWKVFLSSLKLNVCLQSYKVLIEDCT